MDMENLQMFISLVEGTNDLIQSIDADGKLEFVNRVALVLAGSPEGALVRRARITDSRLDLLREVDAIVTAVLDRPPVSQVFPVLVPQRLPLSPTSSV